MAFAWRGESFTGGRGSSRGGADGGRPHEFVSRAARIIPAGVRLPIGAWGAASHDVLMWSVRTAPAEERAYSHERRSG